MSIIPAVSPAISEPRNLPDRTLAGQQFSEPPRGRGYCASVVRLSTTLAGIGVRSLIVVHFRCSFAHLQFPAIRLHCPGFQFRTLTMLFDPPLQRATLLRRYKRFLADVELADGREMTLHCPNTGSMRACLAPGSPCWFSRSDNPKRKYPCTWELATTPAGDLAGINTGRANRLVVEAIGNGVVGELQGYDELLTEVRYGEERSRIDILLRGGRGECYVEVKSVTLCEGGGRGLFPDAVSTRGSKHLRELAGVAASGARAVLFYCVQHSAIERVAPAREIDPDYAAALQVALDRGVEVLAYQARLSPQEVALYRRLPFSLD